MLFFSADFHHRCGFSFPFIPQLPPLFLSSHLFLVSIISLTSSYFIFILFLFHIIVHFFSSHHLSLLYFPRNLVISINRFLSFHTITVSSFIHHLPLFFYLPFKSLTFVALPSAYQSRLPAENRRRSFSWEPPRRSPCGRTAASGPSFAWGRRRSSRGRALSYGGHRARYGCCVRWQQALLRYTASPSRRSAQSLRTCETEPPMLLIYSSLQRFFSRLSLIVDSFTITYSFLSIWFAN